MWKVNPQYLPDGINPDDYRFTDRGSYEEFRAAVSTGKYAKSVTGWIAFIDDSRLLSSKVWPEFTDDLDFFDAHTEITCN